MSFIQEFKDLCKRYKALLILNHHCGKKNDDRPPHKDNLLGSQGFESSMRLVLELRRDFADTGKRHLCIVKGNYLDEDYKNASFVLDFSFETGFTNTEQRVKFDKLVRVDPKQRNDERLRRDERILALKKNGLSHREIEKKMNEEGFTIGHSAIGGVIKKNCPPDQPPLEETNGQPAK